MINVEFDLQDMLGADQAYEGLYGGGSPNVNNATGARMFQQGNKMQINLESNANQTHTIY